MPLNKETKSTKFTKDEDYLDIDGNTVSSFKVRVK